MWCECISAKHSQHCFVAVFFFFFCATTKLWCSLLLLFGLMVLMIFYHQTARGATGQPKAVVVCVVFLFKQALEMRILC